MEINWMKGMLGAVGIAMIASGCGQAVDADQSECADAADYLQACMPDEQIAVPDSCDAAMAASILDNDCATLRASAADGKADGCNPWFWWTCTSDDSSDDTADGATDDTTEDSTDPVERDGLVCGDDVRHGDFERSYDGNVDAITTGNGLVFAAIDDWNRTIGSDDDRALVCVYEIGRRMRLSEEDCFEAVQPETGWDDVNPIDGMALEGDLLYVAIDRGLFVYDVSNVDRPALVGEYTHDRDFVTRDLEVRDGIVYLGGAGHILDASTPSDIEHLAEIGPFIHDWTIDGDTAYAALGTNGVATFDVSNPAAPVLLDTFTWTREGRDGPTTLRPDQGKADFVDIAYEDGHIYVAATEANVRDDESGLWIFDVSDATDITEVHRSEGAPREGIQVAVADGYLFHARRVIDGYSRSHHEVGVYDVSNPAAPRRVENFDDAEGEVSELLITDDGNVVYSTFDWGYTGSGADDGLGTLRSACD